MRVRLLECWGGHAPGTVLTPEQSLARDLIEARIALAVKDDTPPAQPAAAPEIIPQPRRRK